MQNNNAITVKNVSKKYRLFPSAKERFLEALHPFQKKYHKEFWALKNISFDIPKGSTVGIMGRNGSGKSTILKIIFSVLQPTSGDISVNGKISALLELGAGFNPEFTGRTNVIFNGVVSGFSTQEMKSRMALIEEFADIGEFIDQPVKTYSSGMFIRLAFAAAINIDPDILIIDEALSVGDAKFQHKCFNKFLDFQKAGKTILFVSHSTDAIVRHCDFAIMLEGGRVVEKGSPKIISDHYLDILLTNKIIGYAGSPILVEDGYKGFNIIHFGMKYYGFLQSLGHVDIESLNDENLHILLEERKCVIGFSHDDIKHMVDQTTEDTTKNTLIAKKEKTALEVFFEENSVEKCDGRNSYNKNEYRLGNRKAEIIDYILVAGDKYEPLTVNMGDSIDIYYKVRYLQDVEFPMYGFAIKTLDGLLIYGNNTRLSKSSVSSAKKNDIIVFKFSIKLNIYQGDVFIDLGVAEKDPAEDIPVDVRKSLIHIHLQENERFTGLVRLDTACQEICIIEKDDL